MHIASSRIVPSPLGTEFSRVLVCIASDRRGPVLDYWFDLPADLAPARVPGDSLAALVLPIACHAHEDVHLETPVDPLLLENLHGLQRIWRSWYPDLRPAHIAAPAGGADRARAGRGTLASFSGGVDSFFTLLRHQDTITDLLSIGGFNTPLEDFAAMRRDLEPIARRFGKRLVAVRTNVRYGGGPVTVYSTNGWMNDLAHGALLGAVAHLLRDRCATYLIPATHDYSQLIPYGSHPLTDPLLSSSALAVAHDGAAFDRVERTEVVAASDEALAALHVCFSPFTQGNCSRCQKCVRTMATIDLLGARERAVTFDWSRYSLTQVAAAWLPTENERLHFRHIRDHARAAGRLDLAVAIERAIASSRRRARVSAAFQAAKDPAIRLIKSNRITGTAWNGLRALKRATT